MKRNCILYVDDEVSNLRGFKSLFFTDYKVLTASSASEGLELLKENEVDLVISDQKMPEINGVEFLMKVAQLYPDTVRIILTGYSDLEMIIKAVNECGIFRYMAKPWNLDEMKLTIENGLESFRLKKENSFLVQQLQENNQKLEEKVRNRTAQLDEQNQLLKKLNKDKDDLIGIVAHDLKSPLNQICGILNLIKLKPEINTNGFSQYLDLIDDSANRLRNMISQVLDINNIESGNVQLKYVDIPINELFDEVIRLYSPGAKEKKIVIETKVKDDISIHCDRFYLVQILENLLSNAIKYSPENSNITLKADKRPENGNISLSICDEGPGFTEEDKKRLFTPYQKLSASPSRGESSSGLGLSIVKKYADILNSHISCTSEPGEGTCFELVFMNE
jgi:two-component system sensor histidine kinase/response regulator